MIIAKGVDPAVAFSIFDKLKYDLDPAIGGSFDFSLLIADPFIYNYLTNRIQNINKIYETIIADTTYDSLSTHPSTSMRKQKIAAFLADESLEIKGYEKIGDFEAFKTLASWVLIDTYIENGWYIECLDQVLKLRKDNPNDDYLIKSQAKLLLLLTQKKYDSNPFSQLINNRGSAYTNIAYLEFKEMFLGLNAPELNMMSILMLDELMEQNENPYLLRIKSYLIQFLYKYNPGIFTLKDDKLLLIESYKLTANTVRVNELSSIYTLTSPSQSLYKELTSEKGFRPVDVKNDAFTQTLFAHFLSTYKLNNKDLESIETYKKRRSIFEQMLTSYSLGINLVPPYSAELIKQGSYIKSPNCNVSDSIALVQSTSFFIQRTYHKNAINYKQSLALEDEVMELLKESPNIDKNFSNMALDELTMHKISMHYYPSIWTFERFNFTDLIYSAVDEEIEKFKEDEGIRYLLFNLNVSSYTNTGLLKNAVCSNNIYFDLQNEGICYLSKAACREKGSKMIYKQLFSLSDFYLK